MVLGWEIPLGAVVAGGIALLALVVFQMLVGTRVIRFKGRTHMRVHKWGAWVLTAFALVHASLAMVYVMGWRLLS